MVRTGTMAGTTGPTYFLLKGTKCKKNFNDDYLVRYRMHPGSAIIMTENAYMTDKHGYISSLYIKENPMWHVCELLDGFKSHKNVHEAHELLSSKCPMSACRFVAQTATFCVVSATCRRHVSVMSHTQENVVSAGCPKRHDI